MPPELVEVPRSGEIPASLGSPVRFVLHYLGTRRLHYAGLAALVLGAASCAVGAQYGMKLLVDAMAATPGAAVWQALALFIALIAVESVLWRLSGVVGCRATIATGIDIRLDLVNYVIGHPIRFFQETMAGSLGHRITAAAGSFGAVVNKSVWDVGPPVVNFVGALVLFAALDWRMAAALALFAGAITGGLLWFAVRGRPLHTAYARQAGQAGGELVDLLANIWTVKAFSASARERARLFETFSAEADAQRRSWMFLEKVRAFHDIGLWIMAGSLLVSAVYLWSIGRITPGDVVLISALGFRILQGSRDLSLAFVDITQNLNHIGETLRVIGVPHSVSDAPNARDLVRRGGALNFENVSFAYSRAAPVLHDLTLAIPAGQTVGVVGPSGAGKSTLVHLLQRMHDVQGGRVLVDGQPVGSLRQESLRAAIAVVPQEVVLFHRSVMENIRFGRADASDADVRKAAAAANCAAFIEALPRGYDTIVGERGTLLSGGQRQRIGIARAFLKDAPIIVLDEATSALDTDSELEVQRAIAALMQRRTVLAVAHRLSTIAGFDRILVLVAGAIVEDGSFGDLMARDGVFARMWRLQAEGMLDESMAVAAE